MPDVNRASPAAEAGLKRGDIILKVENLEATASRTSIPRVVQYIMCVDAQLFPHHCAARQYSLLEVLHVVVFGTHAKVAALFAMCLPHSAWSHQRFCHRWLPIYSQDDCHSAAEITRRNGWISQCHAVVTSCTSRSHPSLRLTVAAASVCPWPLMQVSSAAQQRAWAKRSPWRAPSLVASRTS